MHKTHLPYRRVVEVGHYTLFGRTSFAVTLTNDVLTEMDGDDVEPPKSFLPNPNLALGISTFQQSIQGPTKPYTIVGPKYLVVAAKLRIPSLRHCMSQNMKV